MGKIELIQGDCLEKMKDFPDKCIDIVFTSPPYNMNLRIRNGKYCSRQIVKELSTKYKNFADNMPMEEYYNFNSNVIDECLRVANLVFYNVQFLTGNKVALFELIGNYSKQIKEIIVWDKINAQPAIGNSILNSQYEIILVFDKTNAISRQFTTGNFNRGALSNCWGIKRGKKVADSHGAVFPVELAEKVISSFSKENNIVLDPFMGVGTTGVACKKLNRNFIGIEVDTEYFKIAEKRINENI